MNIKNSFLANEIPYKELEDLGITKKQFLDLPKEALKRILTGRMSPVLKLRVCSNGKSISIPAKLALTRNDGKVELKIFPKRKEILNDLNLGEKELQRLKAGEALKKNFIENGIKKGYYLQLDKMTKSILRVKTDEIHIPESIKNVVLGQRQKEQIKEGKPIEIELDGNKITAGIDLNSQSGFQIVKGDMTEWEKKKAIEWDMASPGAMGYWQTTENGWEYQQEVEKLHPKQNITSGQRSESPNKIKI